MTYVLLNSSAYLIRMLLFVLSLNEKAYEDDSQIVAIQAFKFYTDYEPRVEVKLRKI
jgi:hypothetical protein